LTPVWICLGSNLGDREDYLNRAREEMAREGLEEEVASALYETAPFGPIEQPPFLNQVLRGLGPGEVTALLASLKEIERRLGRGGGPRWGPRTVDLDILLFGEEGQGVLNEPVLRIPHTGLEERAFVLVPLAEVDPQLVIPETEMRVEDLLRALGEWGHLVWRYSPSNDKRSRAGA